jgi:DNA mismatch repair protein MutL
MVISHVEENSTMPLQWRILGQLWDMYVLLEDNDFLYFVDQHALAERITYERMRSYIASNTTIHQLLQPVSVATSP